MLQCRSDETARLCYNAYSVATCEHALHLAQQRVEGRVYGSQLINTRTPQVPSCWGTRYSILTSKDVRTIIAHTE